MPLDIYTGDLEESASMAVLTGWAVHHHVIQELLRTNVRGRSSNSLVVNIMLRRKYCQEDFRPIPGIQDLVRRCSRTTED